jgi:hypothetical protein
VKLKADILALIFGCDSRRNIAAIAVAIDNARRNIGPQISIEQKARLKRINQRCF